MTDHTANIKLILGRVRSGPLYTLVSPSMNQLSAPSQVDPSTGLLYAAKDHDLRVANETALAIITYVENMPLGDREIAGTLICRSANKDNNELIGALVLSLGLANSLFDATYSDVPYWLCKGLVDALRFMPRTATEDELRLLKLWSAMETTQRSQSPMVAALIRTVPYNGEAAQSLRAVLDDVRRFRLMESVLRNANPIVDRDRRELLSHLSRLKVPVQILDLLSQADANADSGDHKAGIDKLRTFLERVYEECCRRSPAAQEHLPTKIGGNIKPWIDCARDAGLISKYEYAVVQALSSFQAMEASHALKSEPRQYSVAKASVIEWCLLLADRAG